MANENRLHVDVHVTPMRPIVGSAGPGPGDEPMWSPMSSTLISGERDAVLVDTLVTYDHVDTLVKWVEGFGKRVVGILITHGHSDHWIGLGRLLEHFPDARGLATAGTVARARFEASDETQRRYWQGIFPGEVPEDPVLPELLEGGSFTLEGHTLEVTDIGQGDTEHSAIVHVPSIGAVVAGDVVYNQVHMMMAFTDAAARGAWIASLDAIAALAPRTVVSGHKRVGAPDSPDTIEQSRRYIRDFSRIASEQGTVEGLVGAMMQLHGDRDNPRTLWHSARMVLAQKG
ncbi:MBL fold metallo-hydrolase [Streptomyces sp. NPDC048281]|uniref:MBL fold metallo-hydrolase n=1 Tax=Streptomyces sp. NPDC048281 TaxID=3154715 RepID=UPI0034301D49